MAKPNVRSRIILVLVILLAGFLVYRFIRNTTAKQPDFSGVVEATTYDLGFEVPGTIQNIYITEGQRVKKGTLLAKLNNDALTTQVAQARARYGQAQANLANLVAGARPEEIQQARAQLEGAQADLEKLLNGPTQDELNQARSAMEAARQQYQMTENGPRAEDIAAARSATEATRSNLITAKTDYERYKRLYASGAVPAQALDQQRNRYEVTLSQHQQAQDTLKKLQTGSRSEEKQMAYETYLAQRAVYENLAKGTRPELIEKARTGVDYWQNQVAILVQGPRVNDVKAAQKKVDEAKAALDTALVQLSKTKLYSPVDGIVTQKNFEEQESVGGGTPVISVADLENPWVYVFVPEPDIGKIKLGEKAQVTVDSFPGQAFEGSVIRIFEKVEFTPKNIQTQRERVNLVFRVKIAAKNPDLSLKPGMPADVELAEYENKK